jgi:hypothetical protein
MTGETFDPRWDGAFIPETHWHFHRQLLQRYGIVLKPRQYSKIVKSIQRGKALPVETKRDGAIIYCVYVGAERVYLLANGRRLITAWPPDKRLHRLRDSINQRQQPA